MVALETVVAIVQTKINVVRWFEQREKKVKAIQGPVACIRFTAEKFAQSEPSNSLSRNTRLAAQRHCCNTALAILGQALEIFSSSLQSTSISILTTYPARADSKDDQRRDTIRAGQLARQSHHDLDRSISRKLTKEDIVVRNAKGY